MNEQVFHFRMRLITPIHGAEFADDLRRSRKLTPLIGLLIPDLEPSDVSAGDELTSEHERLIANG